MLLSAGALGAVAVLDAGVGCPVTTGTAAGGMGTGVGANGDWTLGVDDEKRRPNGSGMLSYVTLCTTRPSAKNWDEERSWTSGRGARARVCNCFTERGQRATRWQRRSAVNQARPGKTGARPSPREVQGYHGALGIFVQKVSEGRFFRRKGVSTELSLGARVAAS